MNSETIVAIATPPGRGGIGVVRVSGEGVPKIAQSILGIVPQPRYAFYGDFLNKSLEAVDRGIALYFPAPNSFTGEDVLELHGHGGPIVLDEILQIILSLGARLANPGEFSERAFLNNKIDLVQAEAIADLINADSASAARGAIRSLHGEFSQRIGELVELVIKLRVQIESAIDFAEEALDFIVSDQIHAEIAKALAWITNVQNCAKQGILIRDGIKVVIAGKPNVGKSSLLNKLSATDIAIVTAVPGTTRDVLCAQIQLDGIPLQLFDTAGVHASDDIVEQEGIRRAHLAIDAADLILLVVDQIAEDQRDPNIIVPSFLPKVDKDKVIVVFNKIDLIANNIHMNDSDAVYISAKHGVGLDILRQHMRNKIGVSDVSGAFSARRRHLEDLSVAEQCLLCAQENLRNGTLELVAEDLRQTQHVLGAITGEFTTTDLLERIFAEFCVGK